MRQRDRERERERRDSETERERRRAREIDLEELSAFTSLSLYKVSPWLALNIDQIIQLIINFSIALSHHLLLYQSTSISLTIHLLPSLSYFINASHVVLTY